MNDDLLAGAALAGASVLGAFLLAASACEVDLLDGLAFERSLRAVDPLLDCLGGCILRQLEAVGVGCHRALSREGQRRERAFFRVGEGEHIFTEYNVQNAFRSVGSK